MMQKNLNESGQAFMELTVMLLILSAMMLAVIMLSGLEITSNSILLSARTNAQENSQDASFTAETRNNELRSWGYRSLDLTKSYIHSGNQGSFGAGAAPTLYKEPGRSGYKLSASNDGSINIPFSYQGTPINNTEEESLKNARYTMTSGYYTEPLSSPYETYANGEWRDLTLFDRNLNNDFSASVIPNAFDLANLVSADGNGSSRPVTINKKDQAGLHSAANAADIMYGTFKDLFGVDLTDIKLNSHETNHVYMPIH